MLCLEWYADKVGAPFGVKPEDRLLVTKDGARLLCTYPLRRQAPELSRRFFAGERRPTA